MPRVFLNGINIFYEEYGQGFPILLLHGFAGTTASWAPQVEALSQKYRFIVYDMRGHGQTDSPSELSAYSMDILIEDQRQLLQRLGVKQAAVGGLSLGGSVAMRFYIKHPGVVRTLVLADTAPGFRNPQGKSLRDWNENWLSYAELIEKQGMAAYLKSEQAKLDYYTKPDVMLKHNPAGLANIIRGVMVDQMMAPLEKIKVPALLISGDEDTLYLKAAEYMNQHIPVAQNVVIQKAGHGANVDQPDIFNRAILDFLKGLGL